MKKYRVVIYDFDGVSFSSPILSYEKAIDYYTDAIQCFVRFNMYSYTVEMQQVTENGYYLWTEKSFGYTEKGEEND